MAREHDFIFGSSDFIVGQKHFWATSNSEAATSLPEMTVQYFQKLMSHPNVVFCIIYIIKFSKKVTLIFGNTV